MKTILLTDHRFRVAETPPPEPPRAGEVVLRMLVNGVCDSEVHRATHGVDTDALLGHEGVGRIEQIGPDVRGFEPGQLVAADGGTFAQYARVPAASLAAVPEGVAPHLAMGEPIACCVHASWRFGIREGDKVAVVGCGFMGLVCLQLAAHARPSQILAIEPLDWRRQTALESGATAALAPDDTALLAQLESLGRWHGPFDVVIECAGNQPALDLSGRLVTQHGRIVIVGHHKSDKGLRQVNMNLWNVKAIDVVNGHVRRANEKVEAMRQGLQMLADGRLKLDRLVQLWPMDQVNQAFDALRNRQPGLFKAVLDLTT